MRTVVIGGGATGTLAAVHLLTDPPRSGRTVEIEIIERTGHLGQGLAYHSANRDTLMNTPIGKVSAFAADPGHLLHWAQGRAAYAATDFLPRFAYGEYLADTFAAVKAQARGSVTVVKATATAVRLGSNGDSRFPASVELDNGTVCGADLVVLAMGNSVTAQRPAWPDVAGRVDDPWTDDLGRIGANASVLLVGTGLTMADVAMSLAARCPGIRMHAVSRHGLMPAGHAPACGHDDHVRSVDRILMQATLREMVAVVRQEIRGAPGCWREILDGLRPHSEVLWNRLTTTERTRFHTRFGRYWDVHRHRLPVLVSSALNELVQDGRLRLWRGEVAGLRSDSGGVVADLDQRGHRTRLQVDWVVNCTGFGTDLGRSGDPLLTQLTRIGLVRPDSLGLGLAADGLGRVLGPDGQATRRLLAMGPLLRGTRFETTAIPEIRAQAAALAGYARLLVH